MPLSIGFSIAGSVCGGVAAAAILGHRRWRARLRDVAWASAAGVASWAISAALLAGPDPLLVFALALFFGVVVVLVRSAF